MSEHLHECWRDANQAYLTASLALLKEALARHAEAREKRGASSEPPPCSPARQQLEEATEALTAPAALDTLCRSFGLSAFERDVLLLCAGVELEASFGSNLAAAQGDANAPRPTFGLALAALPDAHWSALLPSGPLRHWRLLQIGAGETLATSTLRIDERVLHYLTGLAHLDEHLVGFIEPAPAAPAERVPSHECLVQKLAASWQSDDDVEMPVVELCGNDAGGKRAVASAATAMLGLKLYVMPAQVVPSTPHELDTLIRLWEREAALSRGALLVDCEDRAAVDAAREGVLDRFLERTGGILMLASPTRRPLRHRSTSIIDVNKPTAVEQRVLWSEDLGAGAAQLNGAIDRLTAHFDLGAAAIRSVCIEAHHDTNGDALEDRLWSLCRSLARPRLSDLAQRIAPVAAWRDLVLPEIQRQTLRDIAVHVRQRARVYEDWGFAQKSARGLGISALFSGASGTGKTMAAEVLANKLELDLYRIDLSQVVSKYIGETEKNLRQVFDAAEEGGAILLFDEADALFGKRSEVKDSHDRYANIEVSYLLQRMESYRGLAILTTNMKDAIDDAFMRRIRWVVAFPFPDANLRAEIWRRIFPAATPTGDLDPVKLARLNVPGGNIRNIALHAAFLAADEDRPVHMQHLLRAARIEYAKLEKPLTDNELRGLQ